MRMAGHSEAIPALVIGEHKYHIGTLGCGGSLLRTDAMTGEGSRSVAIRSRVYPVAVLR